MSAVAVRRAHECDLAALHRVSNHYIESSHVNFEVEPLTMEERRDWYAEFADRGRYQIFVAHSGSADSEGELIGFAHSRSFRAKPAYETSVETTIYLVPEATGRGAGEPLYEALFAALRDEDVHRAYAGIALPNPASVAFHERLGFRPIGVYEEVGRKFGRYWSVAWYERSRI